jgi:chloramphenicol-sensitive protein RarD
LFPHVPAIQVLGHRIVWAFVVLGILQYISPTIQFLLGVFVIREPFTQTQLSGFVLVWLGLIVFGFDGVRTRRTSTAAVLDEDVA